MPTGWTDRQVERLLSDIRSRHADGTSFFGFGDRETWRLTVPSASTSGLMSS